MLNAQVIGSSLHWEFMLSAKQPDSRGIFLECVLLVSNSEKLC